METRVHEAHELMLIKETFFFLRNRRRIFITFFYKQIKTTTR